VMLRGFYQYFALHHCDRRLSWIRHETQRQWKQALQRRGQRRRLSWAQLGETRDPRTRLRGLQCVACCFPLTIPRLSLTRRAFDPCLR
jgi:hypothetical protein